MKNIAIVFLVKCFFFSNGFELKMKEMTSDFFETGQRNVNHFGVCQILYTLKVSERYCASCTTWLEACAKGDTEWPSCHSIIIESRSAIHKNPTVLEPLWVKRGIFAPV